MDIQQRKRGRLENCLKNFRLCFPNLGLLRPHAENIPRWIQLVLPQYPQKRDPTYSILLCINRLHDVGLFY